MVSAGHSALQDISTYKVSVRSVNLIALIHALQALANARLGTFTSNLLQTLSAMHALHYVLLVLLRKPA